MAKRTDEGTILSRFFFIWGSTRQRISPYYPIGFVFAIIGMQNTDLLIVNNYGINRQIGIFGGFGMVIRKY